MGVTFRISAKKLGDLNMPDFCERCFWIRQHLERDPPYSVFPRIFNDLDGYVKRVVHGYFDENGVAPPMLKGLGKLKGYIHPPRSRDFIMPIANATLSGEADAILKKADGTLLVADYKTAFCRGIDDPLYPIYVVQLNCYALLAEHHKLGKVSELALVYTEPCTGDASARLKDNLREDGFALGFRLQILPIPLDTSGISTLMARAVEIYKHASCPAGRDGCDNCAKLDHLIEVVSSITSDVETFALV